MLLKRLLNCLFFWKKQAVTHETPHGQVLRDLFERPVHAGISPRGLGTRRTIGISSRGVGN